MRKVDLVQFAFVYGWLTLTAYAQSPTAENQPREIRVVVGSPERSSDKVIAVPPDTSWTGTIAFRGSNRAEEVAPGSVAESMRTVSALNGLDPTTPQPWHIVIAYDQFDEDGDNVHSGVIEELWAGPKKYRISYKSDTLNQTDFATEQGLFRLGDQRWPNRVEMQARNEVVNPFAFAATLQDVKVSSMERTFGPHVLHCIVFERSGVISAPTQYCFDRDGTELRYARGEGWFQTAYNGIGQIEGRNVARQVEVTDGGHRFLSIQVRTIEAIVHVDERELAPPADAVNLTGQRVTGVNPRPVQNVFPEWPSSIRLQHFSIALQIVIGKDGRVVSAQALSGPPEAFKAAEAAVRKWRYQPYLVLGEPAEVETKVQLTNQ
jgi:hypothetical protein